MENGYTELEADFACHTGTLLWATITSPSDYLARLYYGKKQVCAI
jgi:hypothetical protein